VNRVFLDVEYSTLDGCVAHGCWVESIDNVLLGQAYGLWSNYELGLRHRCILGALVALLTWFRLDVRVETNVE
jgi:hypothetical protein